MVCRSPAPRHIEFRDRDIAGEVLEVDHRFSGMPTTSTAIANFPHGNRLSISKTNRRQLRHVLANLLKPGDTGVRDPAANAGR